jgi:exodeoxyribonuclease VII large subunit
MEPIHGIGGTDLLSRDVLTVSRLNSEVRAVLEGSFPLLWVEGEVSNLASPSSGHSYFSLKDAHAQVRCALFRMQRSRLRVQPRNGLQVLVRARVSLYEGRGEFQLIVEHLEPAGEGALRLAFERLKQKLAAEGLFETSRKRGLPAFPRQLGVITSPSGAAVRDVLSVLRRRLPGVPVVIYPAQVQGSEAPGQIVAALTAANRRRECDLLLLVRGGGSLEDLMAFNEESVARAVADSEIPVVTGIGHEIDFTIADFVADRRAPTPSAAAELATPDRRELLLRVGALWERAGHSQRRRLEQLHLRWGTLAQRLQRLHPARLLLQRQQRIDELDVRLPVQIGNLLRRRRAELGALAARLQACTPEHRLERSGLQLLEQRRRLGGAMRQTLMRLGDRTAMAVHTLNAVSPLATLARGYAIVVELPERQVLHDASRVRPGARVEARLQRGALLCRVEASRAKD